MLKVFSIDAYSLFDLDATLSFVMPLVAKKFDSLPDILNEPFMLSTLVDESVHAKRLYRNCPTMFPNRITYFELVELYMFDCDVIMGIV